MGKAKFSIMRLVLPLAIMALACSFFSLPENEAGMQEEDSSSIKVSNTPVPTVPASPEPSATQPLPTKTSLPPTPTLTPVPVGFEIIPAVEVENRSSTYEEEPAINVKSEVFFGGDAGGGGHSSCVLPSNWSLPFIGDGGWGYGWSMDQMEICLLGFPIENEITLKLFDPDGKYVSEITYIREDDFLIDKNELQADLRRGIGISPNFMIEERGDGETYAVTPFENSSDERIEEEMIFIRLRFPPVVYPEGSWTLMLDYNDMQNEYKFKPTHPKRFEHDILSFTSIEKKEFISILSNLYLNPFEEQRFEYYHGETLYFVGAGYEPNSSIPVGIYYETDERKETPEGFERMVYELVYSADVKTGSKGQYWFSYNITDENKEGRYFIVDILDPDLVVYDKLSERSFNISKPKEDPTPTVVSNDKLTATSAPDEAGNSSEKPLFNWIPEVAFKSQSSGYFANLKIDSQDDLHLGFFQDTNDIVWWIEGINNKWTTQEQVTGGSGRGFHVSMVLDGKDYPHFAYHSLDTKKQEPFLFYKYWKGSEWMGVFKNAEYRVVDTDISLALGPDDKPHFVFLEDYGNNLVYSRFGSNGFENQIIGRGNSEIKSLSLAVDQNGIPHMAYQSVDQGLVYASLLDENWIFEIIDPQSGVGAFSDIAIDEVSNIHIAYYDQNEQILKYASRSSDGWDIQVVDVAGNVGQYPSIVVDGSGNIHISYYDVGNTALKYAYGNDEGWAVDTVDNHGSVGEYTSIELDSKDLPYVAYLDGDNKDLKLARAMPLSP